MLLERDVQARRLDSAFEIARSGRCQVVLATGATGTGKTELLHDITGRAAQAGAAVLLALGTEHTARRPLGILHQLLSRAAERRAETAPPDPPRTDTAVAVVDALHADLAALALRQPVVIGIDDVHHADPESLRWIPYLIGHLRQAAVLFVLTETDHAHGHDPVFLTDLLRLPTFHQIRLKALSQAAVEQAIRLELGSPAARAWAASAMELTAGNPLLVQALLRDYRQVVWQGGGPLADSEPPETGEAFTHAVTAWLHRSGRTVQSVARALAVLEADDCHEIVADLLRIEVDTVVEACGRLADAGLAAGTRLSHPSARTAVAGLADASATRDMYRRAARCLYDAGAEASAVARCLLEARDVSAPWAPTVLIAAAVQALRDDAVDDVLGFLALVDSPGVSAEHRLTAAAILMRVHWRANPANSLRHVPTLESALRAEKARTCHAVGVLKAMLWPGHVDDAARFLKFLRGRDDRDAEAAAVVDLLDLWVLATYPGVLDRIGAGARPDAGDLRLDVPARTSRGVGTRAWPGALRATLTASECLARVLTGGRDGAAAATATSLLRHSELDDGTHDALEAAVLTLLYGDQPAAAAHWAGHLLEQAAARDVPLWQATFASVLAEAALRLGQPEEAARQARAALAALPASRWGAAAGTPVATLIRAADALGDHDEAAAQLRRPVPAGTFESRHGLHYLYARGHHHLHSESLPAALADFQSCSELAVRWGLDRPGLVPWRSGAAAALLGLGDRDQAGRLAAEQLERTGAAPSRSRGLALRALAAVSAPEARLTPLAEAVATLEVADDRLSLAEALVDLGAVHWSAGEPGKARRLTRRALHLAEQSNAGPLRSRCLEQIALYRTAAPDPARRPRRIGARNRAEAGGGATAAGAGAALGIPSGGGGRGDHGGGSRGGAAEAGPARPATPGAATPGAATPAGCIPSPSPLTAAELRVATLATLGLTNRQIAERLYVTTSTVEQHLTHVYRKLRVRNRAELPTGLRQVWTSGVS